MDKDIIDLIDTTIKIGLGSLISGISAYYGIKLKRSSDRHQFVLEHKIKLIEKISLEIDTFFSAHNSLVSCVLAAATEHRKDQEMVVYSSRFDETIEERGLMLTESWDNRGAAVSKLRLLKANDVVDKLRECTNLENKLRQALWFEKKHWNYNQCYEYRENLTKSQRLVHEALADLYSNL